jgi:aryl-alcohol dehydrogenase-like predicted oxidoreductase
MEVAVSLTRRSFLRVSAGASASLLLDRIPLHAQQTRELIRRPIPKSGEMIPIIGLGSVGTFNLTPDHPEYEDGREVLRRFVALGGKVIDTAPGYGNSESFIGESIQALGIRDDVFLATKFNALQISAGRGVRASGGEAADKAVMQSQLEESLATFGRQVIDLQQVWNLGDVQSNAQVSSVPAGYLQWHMEKALEWKQAGRTRYIGITTSRDPQYAEVEAAMSRYPIDFMQVDYSIEDRLPEQRLLPAAKDNGVAVLINRPFVSGSLFRQATQSGKTIPEWATEIGIDSWGKFFLKYVVSHPSVTAAIPATGNPVNLVDNMGAGVGPLPDESMRQRMRAFWEAGR